MSYSKVKSDDWFNLSYEIAFLKLIKERRRSMMMVLKDNLKQRRPLTP
jgi:hypothetical protein